jgi:hypothetical protein
MKLQFSDSVDRNLQEQRNRRYLFFYDIIFCLIYGALVISIDAEAKSSAVAIVFMLTVCFIGALIFRDLLMTIPTWIFLRPVYPEIHLTDDAFIFLGGSEVLNYSPMVRMTAFSTSYYKLSPNLLLPRHAKFEVSIVYQSKAKSRLTWRHERELQIRADNAVLNTLGWLTMDEQQKIKNTIEEWKNLATPTEEWSVSSPVIGIQKSETLNQFILNSLTKQWEWVKPVWRVLVAILVSQVLGMAIGVNFNLTTEVFLNLWYGGAYATPIGFVLGLLWHYIAVPKGLNDNRFILILLGAMSIALPLFGVLTFGIWKLSAVH